MAGASAERGELIDVRQHLRSACDDAGRLVARLREEALALGADFFGVAELAPAHEVVLAQGGEMIARLPRALSLGVKMPTAIVDELPNHRDRAVATAYRTHAYDVLNRRLDGIASRVAGRVQDAGYRAFPIAASKIVDDEHLLGHFSHKLAAHLAGLGWIGKSCLLVTADAGPRVRWASVLTDAPLPVGRAMDERCGGCDACVQACPAHAFTGRAFVPEEPREMRLDVHKCREYQGDAGADGEIMVCGMCVYVCPYGRRTESPDK